MHLNPILILFLSMICPKVFSQNVWNIGDFKRLYFNEDFSISVSNQSKILGNRESTTTVAKGSQLLFYSDGVTVWNENDDIMENGQNLGGDKSSAQGVTVIQFPDDSLKYYLFSLNSVECCEGTLFYSIVDMEENGGLGKVILKKQKLWSNLTEHLIAIKGPCNTAWLISHERNNNAFCLFQVSEKGISSPKKIFVGTNSYSENVEIIESYWIGNLKISNDLKMIVNASFYGAIELFDFDVSSGIISNPRTIQQTDRFFGTYKDCVNACFSPDGRYLYTMERLRSTYQISLAQYDTKAGSSIAINQSRTDINISDWATVLADIQIDPYGRILISGIDSFYLSAIINPNEHATLIDFQLRFVDLGVYPNVFFSKGLHEYPVLFPNPITTPTIFEADAISSCPDEQLKIGSSTTFESYLWSTGAATDSVSVSTSGQYWLEVTTPEGCTYRDTLQVDILDTQSFDLGADITVCDDNSFTLAAGIAADTYLWNTGSTSSSIEVGQSGIYAVSVTTGGCSVSDSIEVYFEEAMAVDLGEDRWLCDAENIRLESHITGDYLWSTGQTTSSITTDQPGLYWLQVTNGQCTSRDTIEIIDGSIDILPSDTILCYGATYTLQPKGTFHNIQWQDGTTTPRYIVNQSGFYQATITTDNCTLTDSITISYKGSIPLNLGQDTTVCDPTDFALLTNILADSYRWQDDSSFPFLEVLESGEYWLEVALDGCFAADTIKVQFNEQMIDLGADTMLCPGDRLAIGQEIPNATYTWQDGSQEPYYNVVQSGNYRVSISTDGCLLTDDIEVSYQDISVDLGEDMPLCANESIILEIPNTNAQILWSDGSQESTLEVDRSGLYWVHIQENDCTVRDSIEIKDDIDCGCKVYIPNVFNPEGAATNRTFSVFGNCPMAEYEVSIYDRWGERIFTSRDPEVSWDGRFRGLMVPTGVYMMKLGYRFDGGEELKTAYGSITVVR